jgi:hypothetical protein
MRKYVDTLATGIAFFIFVVDGQVVWRYCLLAMVVCAIAGYTYASAARRVPQAMNLDELFPTPDWVVSVRENPVESTFTPSSRREGGVHINFDHRNSTMPGRLLQTK